MSALTYAEFVQAKAQFDTFAGFDVDEPAVNPRLLPHHCEIADRQLSAPTLFDVLDEGEAA